MTYGWQEIGAPRPGMAGELIFEALCLSRMLLLREPKPAAEADREARAAIEEALADFRRGPDEFLARKEQPMREDVSPEDMRKMMGPTMVEHMVQQAISCCWMALPKGKQTVENLEFHVRRIVDRAFKNIKEDAQAFGIDDPA